MGLGPIKDGVAAYSAASGTTVAPLYPTGILASDAVLLFVGQKPTTANGGTVTTPTGWTLRDQLTAAGGYGATLGADTGNTNLRVYSWDTPVAGQTGSLTVSLSDNNVSWAFIVSVGTTGRAISYGSATGQRTTTPTSPMSIALTDGATATAFAPGDLALWAMCIPTDVTTPSQFFTQSITATGATFTGGSELNEPDSTAGNDIGGYSALAYADGGPGTSAPTVTVAIGGTLTNVRGPVVLVRVREAAPPPSTGSGSATETGLDIAESSGVVIGAPITGSAAVQEADGDTATSSGVVVVTGSAAVQEADVDAATVGGVVLVTGSTSLQEAGADTATGAGGVVVTGSSSLTTSANVATAAGSVAVSGSASVAQLRNSAFAIGGLYVLDTGGALDAFRLVSDFRGVRVPPDNLLASLHVSTYNVAVPADYLEVAV
jgi:hypothetical protein